MNTFKALNFILFFSFSISVIFIGCSKNDSNVQKQDNKKTENNQTAPPEELSNKGKEIFYTESKSTGLKCADCHSDGTNSDVHYKYFADIFNANKRPSTYFGLFTGNEVQKNAGGANICWMRFLKMSDSINTEQVNALNAFYETIGKGKEIKEFKYTTIALPKPDKIKLKQDQDKIAALTGNAENGEKIYKETCDFCHSGNSDVKKVPSLFKDFEGNLKSITYHIRLGSKHMPYFPYEIINDQQIADVTAFLFKKNNINP